jgi:hypothetical protein
MSRPRVTFLSTIHQPLSTDLSKITGCQPAILPSSGHRDTKPLVTSVRDRAPLSVKPVTGERDVELARAQCQTMSLSHPSKSGLGGHHHHGKSGHPTESPRELSWAAKYPSLGID